MAENIDLSVGIEADVNGTAETKALADTVAAIGDALRGLVADAKSAASAMNRTEKSLAGVGTGARQAVKDVKDLNTELRKVNSATPTLNSQNRIPVGLSTGDASSRSIGVVTKQQREALEATNAARTRANQLEAQQLALLQAQLKSRRDAVQFARNSRIGPTGSAQVGGSFLSPEFAAKQQAAQLAAFDAAAKKRETIMQRTRNVALLTAREELDAVNRLTNARYALYSVQQSLFFAGAGTLFAQGLIIKAAMDYETAMAQISRTSGIAGRDLEKLEDDFRELAQTIPLAFSDLAEIGTLAGQLNIPADEIASFTETVAQFSATTNVTTEASATAFGRLNELLPDVQGNYEALGSSILTVGINSVATESEIISTTSQIAAAGAQARFTSDEVIGLAASFASLGVAPEASRGTTIRVLSEIRTAALEGGEALDSFAKISGMSSEAFREGWLEGDASAVFLQFLEGLGRQGQAAEQSLRAMGITAVRDINALLKLSQNAELVGNNFMYAKEGMDEATQLSSAFGIQSDTLASKLQMLVNSLQGLFAEIGEGGIGPLGVFVDMLKDAAIALTELAQNDVAQRVFVILGVLTALGATVALLSSGLIAVGNTVIAARTAFAAFKVAAIEAGGGVAGFNAALAGTTAVAKLVRGALISTGIGALILLVAEVWASFDRMTASMRTSAEVARDYFSDLSGLKDAIEADTAAVYANLTPREILASTMSDLAEGIDAETGALGENTKAWFANAVAADETLGKLFADRALYESRGLDTKGLLSSLAEGDVAQARAIYDEFLNEFGGMNAVQTDSVKFIASSLNKEDILAIDEAIKAYEGSTQALNNELQLTGFLSESLNLTFDETTGKLVAVTEVTEDTADAFETLSDDIANAFASQNGVSQFASDMEALFKGVAEGGNSFSEFSEAGRTNIDNLQAALESSIRAAEYLGVDASEAVALVFQQLQSQGVNTAQLLASLAGMGLSGVNMSAVQGYLRGTTAMSTNGVRLSNTLGQVRKNAEDASKSITRTGGSAGGAAKQIRTLADYARDLGTVFGRAFEIRFGGGQALDSITSGWIKIAEAADEANKAIRETQATIQSLTADRSIQEYFLTVANAYGDTLRAEVISANIAELNAKIATEQDKLTQAQEDGNKTLTGNSKAAIRNRAAILGLVGDYQGYLQALASSGASQAELQAKAQQLRAEFVQQATQMGYNASEVETYAAAFDDMSIAINGVPRNITVNADTNPARTALAEFLAQNTGGRGASGGINVPIRSMFDDAGYTKSARAAQILAQIAGATAEAVAASASGNVFTAFAKRAQVIGLAAILRSGSYKGGGYTGDGSTSAMAGVVHGKEWVVDADNTKRLGIPFLQALNNGQTPVVPVGAGSAGGTSLAIINPSDIQKIVQALQSATLVARVSYEDAARATNRGNKILASQGVGV